MGFKKTPSSIGNKKGETHKATGYALTLLYLKRDGISFEIWEKERENKKESSEGVGGSVVPRYLA